MDGDKKTSSKNNHSFIINGQVRFIPSRRIIEDMKTGTKVKLHVPASLCLDRLLQNQGRIVSQHELIQCGWGVKREPAVSSNTFYQCMLHLRKKLAQAGLSDVIETVPRHGIIFNDSVSVSMTQGDPLSFELNESKQTKESKVDKSVETLPPADTDAELSSNEGGSLLSSVDVGNTSPGPLLVVTRKEKLRTGISYISVIALLLSTLFIDLNFIYIKLTKDNIFDSYIKLPSTNCSISALDNRYSSDEIKVIMKDAGLPCLNKETIFFTASPMLSRLNIIHCAAYNKKKQDCRSVTIVNELKEDHEI